MNNNDVIQKLVDALNAYSEALSDGPENCTYAKYEEVEAKARAAVAHANRILKGPPTTVGGWLELAREAGLWWAQGALNQATEEAKNRKSLSLANSIMRFGQWISTVEKRDFWSSVLHKYEKTTFEELTLMACQNQSMWEQLLLSDDNG